MGPDPFWMLRPVIHPHLEVFLKLNTDLLEGKAFHMVEVENGVGLEGGYEFELGIPIIGEVMSAMNGKVSTRSSSSNYQLASSSPSMHRGTTTLCFRDSKTFS